MDVYILNTSFKEIGVIDVYQSLIWTTRYYESGDFELYMPATETALEILQIGNYVERGGDENTMIIEKLEIKTNTENGNYIIASGRDLKSILDRRVIIPQQNISGLVLTELYSLINTICGNAAETARKFPNFKTATISQPPQDTINAQVTGDVLYNYIVEVCKTYGYGWKITRSGTNLTCEIFVGVSRPLVHFSPEFDNLINTDYVINATNYKNMAYALGEGEGTARKSRPIPTKQPQGMNRREMYVDARDVSSNEGAISLPDYMNLLYQRGSEKLTENPITQDFSGSVISDIYKYKTDYNVGDIVTVENEYRITAETRIIEMVESWSADKMYTAIPTFENWEVTA